MRCSSRCAATMRVRTRARACAHVSVVLTRRAVLDHSQALLLAQPTQAHSLRPHAVATLVLRARASAAGVRTSAHAAVSRLVRVARPAAVGPGEEEGTTMVPEELVRVAPLLLPLPLAWSLEPLLELADPVRRGQPQLVGEEMEDARPVARRLVLAACLARARLVCSTELLYALAHVPACASAVLHDEAVTEALAGCAAAVEEAGVDGTLLAALAGTRRA